VVCSDNELTWPQVGTQVANSLDEPDQLPLVCGEFGVMRRHGPTKECHRALILVQNGAHARPRHVAFDDERLGEVWQLQHRCRCQGRLEGVKRSHRLCCPAECLALEQLSQGSRDVVVGVNELAVVSHQAKEALHDAHGAGCRPRLDCGNLLGVHGDTFC
jgi:hypothetical protein